MGISAGVSYRALGSTHYSLDDFAVLQAINNIDIVVLADNFETQKAIETAVSYPKPIYIRFGKKAMPHLHQPDTPFAIMVNTTPRNSPKSRRGELSIVSQSTTKN